MRMVQFSKTMDDLGEVGSKRSVRAEVLVDGGVRRKLR